MDPSGLALTPHPAVNALLAELLAGARAVLGPRLLGLYLDGSLVLGDFDADSDIDFIAATESEVTADEFAALQAMHDRLARLDSPWAIQLEGSYIPAAALRRYDPANARHPNLERGPGKRLKWAKHDADWVIHRWVVRERGAALLGPPPKSLIDPVTPDDLRRAVLGILRGWYAGFLIGGDEGQGEASGAGLEAEDEQRGRRLRPSILPRGYQSYLVLSLARILYTLETGAVASKPAAAAWAKAALGGPWAALIERAWAGRQHPQGDATVADVAAMQSFIRLALTQGDRYDPPDI